MLRKNKMNYDDWKQYKFCDELEDELKELERKREAEEAALDSMLMDLDNE